MKTECEDIDCRALLLIKQGKNKEARELIRKEYVPLLHTETKMAAKACTEEMWQRYREGEERQAILNEKVKLFEARQEEVDKKIKKNLHKSEFGIFKRFELKDFCKKHPEVLPIGCNLYKLSKPEFISFLEQAKMQGKVSAEDLSQALKQAEEDQKAVMEKKKEKTRKKYGHA